MGWLRVVYKSRQPAKFAGLSARFCRLLWLRQESRYAEEMMFIRSKPGLNKNINLHCLSFLETYKDFWLKDSLETLCSRLSFGTNLAAVARKFVVWHSISRYECIISASRELGKGSFCMWLSERNCKKCLTSELKWMKAISFRFSLSRQTETKGDNNKWRYNVCAHLWKNVRENKYYFTSKSTKRFQGKMNVKWTSWSAGKKWYYSKH